MKYTTSILERMLAERYSAQNGYGILFDVGNGTGSQLDRRADALVVGLWANKGKWLRGFEIKQDRSDFLREKRDAAKAEAFFSYCREWYLVCGPGVVDEKTDDVPPWGILQAEGSRLVERLKPVPNEDVKPPSTALLTGIFRASSKLQDRLGYVHVTELENQIQERALEIASTLNADLKRKLRHYELEEARMKEGYDESRAYYDEVKRTLDLHVPGAGWAGNKFLAILRVLQANNGGDVLETLSRQMKSIRSTLERAERMLGEATAAAERTEEQRSAEEMKRVQELMKGEE